MTVTPVAYSAHRLYHFFHPYLNWYLNQIKMLIPMDPEDKKSSISDVLKITHRGLTPMAESTSVLSEEGLTYE